ncbi:hypothetical protein [Nitrincola sp. MINF-07-Sa-05]|uniref:hypothetical protein n=1 Tax=Nitrincola salilacus TaxID=3400273 RepID=UPI0039180FDC
MTQNKQWMLLYLGSLLVLGIFSAGGLPLILILGGIVGVIFGLFSDMSFENAMYFYATIGGAVVSFSVGLIYRIHLWGKVVNLVGFYLWCLGGIAAIGFEFYV